MASRSCVTNLIDTLDFVRSCLDSGGHIDMIYIDISKASDKVNHRLLIQICRKTMVLEVTSSLGSSAILKIANNV